MYVYVCIFKSNSVITIIQILKTLGSAYNRKSNVIFFVVFLIPHGANLRSYKDKSNKTFLNATLVWRPIQLFFFEIMSKPNRSIRKRQNIVEGSNLQISNHFCRCET